MVFSLENIKKGTRVLLAYPKRIFNGISFRARVIDSNIHKTVQIEHNANVRYSTIGRYTYISAGSVIIHANIGAFCSVAAGVGIGGGGHNLESVSTSPLFQSGDNIFKKNFGSCNYEPFKITTIGNDVWIGNRAMILQGVSVGDGAVVGAGSVVTKDVQPYAIVAGNPAHVIRNRFDDIMIKELQDSKWWDLDDEKLKLLGNSFSQPEMLLNSLNTHFD